MVDQTLRPGAPLQHIDDVEHRRQIAKRANISLPHDGSYPMTAPLLLKELLVADLTGDYAASLWESGVIYVSDETGGATMAFSDGTNWRRVQDRVVVS